ncbi:MAG: hypothetical protein FWG73_05825 [Planctomycetaceae bacterium]|nr:hypothetical protein [Planctomycetaceae bacterium]
MPILFILLSFALFDAEFVKLLLDSDDAAWQQLADESIPPEQNTEILADLTHKLAHWIPKSILIEHAVRLEGDVVFATKYDNVYHCKMLLHNGQTVDVFVPALPQAWPIALPMQERAAAFGIYIKSHHGNPIFAAPAIEWLPDSWLGNLGFNVALLDHVPVSRVIELEQNDDETNRRMFHFTEADAMPFYALLQAISATPEGWLEEEAKKQQAEMPFGPVDLFNRPNETRGKPILLHGTAKRIIPTPVLDREVQALFGIEHYYQIYLFTDGSRGNPIVVCVRSLPDGMPTGDSNHFAETITVAAVPYKLWIYEAQGESHYAPVLIGREPIWHPKAGRSFSESMAGFSFSAFLVLACIWFACRLWARGLGRTLRPVSV